MWKTLIKSEIGCRFPDPFMQFDVMRVLNVHGGVVFGGYGIPDGAFSLKNYSSKELVFPTPAASGSGVWDA